MSDKVLLKNDRGAWWRDARCGYSDDIADAGLYDRAYAETVARGGRGDRLVELQDVLSELVGRRYRMSDQEATLAVLLNAAANPMDLGPPRMRLDEPSNVEETRGVRQRLAAEAVLAAVDRKVLEDVIGVAGRYGWALDGREALSVFLRERLDEGDRAAKRLESALIVERTSIAQAEASMAEAADLRAKLDAEVERAGHYELDLLAVSQELGVEYLDARLRYPIRVLKAKLDATSIECAHWKTVAEKARDGRVFPQERVSHDEVRMALGAEEVPRAAAD